MSACPLESNDVFFTRFRRQAGAARVPLSGTLEVTRRCNLGCQHCYLGSQDQQHALRDREMSTERVFAVLDEIAAAGCLFLVLTGGEPMVRPDFLDIYVHARRLGLLLTVFTNGTVLDERIVATFERFPPRHVELSIYGASAATHERITRAPGSFGKTLAAVRRLHGAGITVKLKTVLMKPNRDELGAMRNLADDLGVKFRLDAGIFASLHDGDRGPLALRVSPEEAATLELADARARNSWKEFAEPRLGQPAGETLYQCGAGTTAFTISPFGELSPCLMDTRHVFDLGERSFRDWWNTEIASLRERPAPAGFECNSCGLRALCTACPAFNMHETGSETARAEYLCRAAPARWRALFAGEPPGIDSDSE